MMGYTTNFSGQLSFIDKPSSEQITFLASMFDEDCREHPEWNATKLTYIDLEFTEDMMGFQWNGAEKTYYLVEIVNLIITEARKRWPEFGLVGTLMAQGEEIGDLWALAIGDDGFACREEVVMAGKVITCPHCDEKFVVGN